MEQRECWVNVYQDQDGRQWRGDTHYLKGIADWYSRATSSRCIYRLHIRLKPKQD